MDNTTSNHLKIPAVSIEKLVDNNKKPFILEKIQHHILNPYFSSRESGLMENVLIIPFFSSSDKLFSVIIITDAEYFKTAAGLLINTTDLYIDVFTGHLAYFYENIRLKTDKAENTAKKTLMTKLNETSDENNFTNPFVVFFDINKFFAIVAEEYPYLSYSGFKNIIIRLFSSFIMNNGKIFIIEGKVFCLIINSPTLNDKLLMSHQILFIIKNLLPSFKENTNTIMKVFQINSDNESLKDFINADFF